MNLRRTIRRFKSLYPKRRISRIELPEERDAKFARRRPRRKKRSTIYDYSIEKPWYAGRSSGRFRNRDMNDQSGSLTRRFTKRSTQRRRKPKAGSSRRGGRYFRGGGSYYRG